MNADEYQSSPYTQIMYCLGSCSECGGAVVVRLGTSSQPPIPYCMECGATLESETEE